MFKANIPFTLAYLRSFLYEQYASDTNMKIQTLLPWCFHCLDTEAGIPMTISFDVCMLL